MLTKGTAAFMRLCVLFNQLANEQLSCYQSRVKWVITNELLSMSCNQSFICLFYCGERTNSTTVSVLEDIKLYHYFNMYANKSMYKDV